MPELYVVHEEANSLDPSITMRIIRNWKGDYIGLEEDWAKIMDKYGIAAEKISADHNVCSIGFSEKEQKWYGWSHRAIFGFGIGHTVKKGDCNFTADNPEEMIDDYAEFFNDFGNGEKYRAKCQVAEKRDGILIFHEGFGKEFGPIPVAESMDDVAEVFSGEKDISDLPTIPDDWGSGVEFRPCGRGEWTAKTMEDAKQMAIDFARSVA